MHVDTAPNLVNADVQKMIQFRIILEKMNHPSADLTKLEHELMRSFRDMSPKSREGIISVTRDIMQAVHNHHIREALIAYTYKFSN